MDGERKMNFAKSSDSKPQFEGMLSIAAEAGGSISMKSKTAG
jgi:hypothetical protein